LDGVRAPELRERPPTQASLTAIHSGKCTEHIVKHLHTVGRPEHLDLLDHVFRFNSRRTQILVWIQPEVQDPTADRPADLLVINGDVSVGLEVTDWESGQQPAM